MIIKSVAKSLALSVTTEEQRIWLHDLLNKLRTSAAAKERAWIARRGQPFVDRLDQFFTAVQASPGLRQHQTGWFQQFRCPGNDRCRHRRDIRSLKKFPNGSDQEIYACHVLEHFAHDAVMPLLRRWFEVLQPGGVLLISEPDIDRIMRIYQKNPAHFQTKGHSLGLASSMAATPCHTAITRRASINAGWPTC